MATQYGTAETRYEIRYKTRGKWGEFTPMTLYRSEEAAIAQAEARLCNDISMDSYEVRPVLFIPKKPVECIFSNNME